MNDRPPSTIGTGLYLWPTDWAHGLTVDVYDAVHEPPVVVASAEFPVGYQSLLIDMAPTARMALVFGTASTRLFRTGVLGASAVDLARGSFSECIEVLPEQRLAVNVAALSFARPVVTSSMTIPPPKGITIVQDAPPMTLRVLGTAVEATAGVVSYDIVFRMEPAASATNTDQLVDLTVLSLSVTPNAAIGLPLLGMLANAIGLLVSDAVAAGLRATVQSKLGEAAEGVVNEDIPDADVRMTVLSLEALSPDSFEVEAVVGAVHGCDRADAAWNRFWLESIVPAAGELFATDYAGAGAVLADIRQESLAALQRVPAGKIPVERRSDRLSGEELQALLRALVPQTSVRVANLLAVLDSQR